MAQLANQVDELDTLLDGARYGDLGDVQTGLDEYKISVDAVDEQQRTALHMASANGHATIVQLLLERGANVLAENAEGNTPLHWACLNGQEQVVQLLLTNGASAASVNSQGRTPVDEALGKPFQEKVLGIINAFGNTTEDLDRSDDPEDQEMEEASPEDPALKPYNKYGS